MTSKFFYCLLGGIAMLVCIQPIQAAADAALSQGCYAIVDPKDAPTLDNASEVLCVDASGHAVVRESTIFGEGIKGCNIVKVTSKPDAVAVDIDYSRCTNNSPNHRLACHPDKPPGAFACMDTIDRATGEAPVKMVPLPAEQSTGAAPPATDAK